jgi:hypothetical protein
LIVKNYEDQVLRHGVSIMTMLQSILDYHMNTLVTEKNVYHTLRVASAMCFIGHGAFGIITKPIWCDYFAVFGIGQHLAYQLMPVVGIADVLFGLSLLFYPTTIVVLWLVIWGLFTASLRPLSGEPFAEFIERAGNFGAPFALLVLRSGFPHFSGWLKKLNIPVFRSPDRMENVRNYLRWIVFLLLAGHGLLNIEEKKGLIKQYTMLGVHDTHGLAYMLGIIELAAAIIILIRPARTPVLIFLLWKMGSELFYPHWELFEWVERGGSYGALLALWFALKKVNTDSYKNLFVIQLSVSKY